MFCSQSLRSERSIMCSNYNKGFPHSSVGKESAYNAGYLGLFPRLGRSCGEGNGNPLQYSCLENPIGREAWRTTVQGVSKSETERLSHTHMLLSIAEQNFQCCLDKTAALPPWLLESVALSVALAACRKPYASPIFGHLV